MSFYFSVFVFTRKISTSTAFNHFLLQVNFNAVQLKIKIDLSLLPYFNAVVSAKKITLELIATQILWSMNGPLETGNDHLCNNFAFELPVVPE